MAYSSAVKIEAENLFHKGYNIHQIVELLKKKYPRITDSTVTKWSLEKDKEGKCWDDYKQMILVQARKKTHETLTNKYSIMKHKAVIIQEGLEKTLLSGDLEVRSVEGAVYAWKGLAEFIFLIEEKYESRRSPKEVVLEFLDILNSIPELQKYLKKNWSLVETELKKRLESEWEKNV